MSSTNTDYQRALKTIQSLPAELETARKVSATQRDRANQLADQATAAAKAGAAETNKMVELQLAAARTALEPIGRVDLIPLRVKPNSGQRSATRDEIAAGKRELVAAVEQLERAVAAELQRQQAEEARRAREAADRARAEKEAAARAAAEAARLAAVAARRKQLIQIGAVSAAIVVVLIIILLVVL